MKAFTGVCMAVAHVPTQWGSTSLVACFLITLRACNPEHNIRAINSKSILCIVSLFIPCKVTTFSTLHQKNQTDSMGKILATR